MAPREILIKVLVDVDRGVVQRVDEHVHELAGGSVASRAGDLRPAVSAREAVAGGKDELLGTRGADGVDGGLVVLEDELGGLGLKIDINPRLITGRRRGLPYREARC